MIDSANSITDWQLEIKVLEMAIDDHFFSFSEKSRKLMKQHIDLYRKKIQIARS